MTTVNLPFRDHRHAGRALAGRLAQYRGRAGLLMLALPRGGGAVEADWLDDWRVNRYVRGLSDNADADVALSGFQRFPVSMWRITVVRDFVEWLRDHNTGLSPLLQVGVYGLDLYSLSSSIQAVLTYLDDVHPEAARLARYCYACFDHAAEDTQAYGYAASVGLKASCEDEVVQQLREMNRRAAKVSLVPKLERDEAFYAQQNARLVQNAEKYYRTMFHGRVSSWSLRDSHMLETLHASDRHRTTGGAPPRIALWAHNSHLGDASATEMGERGEWNVGQLVRDRYADAAVLVAFSTHRGWVTAASNWHEPPQINRVRDGLPGSWGDVFDRTGTTRFLLPLRDDAALRSLVSPQRLQRAIGVIYWLDTERQSHYFYTRSAQQFDAVIHIDETSAVEPLDVGEVWVDGEVLETFLSGIQGVPAISQTRLAMSSMKHKRNRNARWRERIGAPVKDPA